MCPSDSPDAGSDAMDGGSDGDGSDGSGPPTVLCHNGSCLPLPPTIRANLVLLLWPSNLPSIGSPVSVWADQSGQGNDAHALYPSALPHVIPDGVKLDPTQLGSGFVVANSPSLDFGSGDFAIIAVAGLSSSATRVSLFQKSDGVRENSRQISIDWALSSSDMGRPQGTVNDTVVVTDRVVPQPSVGAYALQRASNRIELHLNGSVLGGADLPQGISTTNAANVYVGVTNLLGSPADSIEAVIAIRGPIGASDLNDLESFLRTLFATPP